MSKTKFRWDQRGLNEMRQKMARGVANVCYAIEGTAKENTPVHGDGSQGGVFPTFVPGEGPIGGTLRRSIHTVVYDDGRVQFTRGETSGSATSSGGEAVGWSQVGDARRGIEGFVGTNVYYAIWVHDGTTKMGARPFLLYAFEQERPRAEQYFMDGFRAR